MTWRDRARDLIRALGAAAVVVVVLSLGTCDNDPKPQEGWDPIENGW